MVKAKLDLITELRRGRFEHALLATYELGVEFFERYCLRSLDAFSNADSVVLFVDHKAYAKALVATGSDRPRLAGRRYYLSPVACRGAFHPKIYLFASKRRGLLVVGSCNLTKAGLSSNAELAGCFRFELDKDETHARLFADVYRWFAGRDGPRSVLDAVEAVGQDCGWLCREQGEPSEGQPRLLTNVERPLWDQLRALAGSELIGCTALSPYFDLAPKLLDELGEVEFDIYSQHKWTTMTPAWLEHPRVQSGHVRLLLTEFEDEGQARILHAKALLMRTASSSLLAYGSANFTTPALRLTPAQGNHECMIAIPGLPADFDVAGLFDPEGRARPATLDGLGERNDRFERPPTPPIELREVCLTATGELRADLRSSPPSSGELWLIVDVVELESARLRLRSVDGRWSATAAEALVKRCGQLPATARVELVRGEERLMSNTVFLQILEQLESGSDRRASRRVRAAIESAEQFHAELLRLLTDKDEPLLIRFLQLCDIRISGRPRMRRRRLVRPGAFERTRVQGRRARKLALSLHAAALDFIDRHHGRLARHASEPTIEGVPSFMHVVRAILDLADAQLTTMIDGLGKPAMRPDEWKLCRDFLADYLVRVDSILRLIAEQYLPRLGRAADAGRVAETLRPDVSAVVERCGAMLNLRERVEQARPTVRMDFDRRIRARYFESDLLVDGRWWQWQAGVRLSLGAIASVSS